VFEVHGNGFRLCWSLFGPLALITYLKYRKKCYCVVRFLGIPVLKSES
jgi:hypothetical protein